MELKSWASALWKLACIAEGIRARYAAGAMADAGVPSAVLDTKIEGLAAASFALLEA